MKDLIYFGTIPVGVESTSALTMRHIYNILIVESNSALSVKHFTLVILFGHLLISLQVGDLIRSRQFHMCFLQPITAKVVAAGGIYWEEVGSTNRWKRKTLSSVELFDQGMQKWSAGNGEKDI